jgi:Flp pilus assembly protein TadD
MVRLIACCDTIFASLMLEWQYSNMKYVGIRIAIGLLLATTCPTITLAQEADDEVLNDGATPPPVIVEPSGSRELREAMRRIAVRPKDPEALFDAGNAALMLGDAGAALNFFTRAANLRPSDGRIKAGLGAATVRTENPFEALRLFDEAVKLGISERSIAVDRALAYDLLGNFARAQQDYQLARTAAVTDQLSVQQAVSLSLSGAKTEADNMLVPLLQKNNLDAWRARAFMLAARGELKESSRVTSGFLDSASAKKMESYLRLMPQLTGAQQAAAIHFGHFPQSYQIGRDSAAVTRTAANSPQPSTGAGRLTPSGTQLGSADPAKSNPAIKPNTAPVILSRQEREVAAAAAKKIESQKAAEILRVAEAKKQAEAAQLAEAQKKQEAARIAEQQRVAEAARITEQQRVAEAARITEQQRLAEAARITEQQRLAEFTRVAEQQRLADAARVAEQQRIAETARVAETQRVTQEQRIAENTRIAQVQQQAEFDRTVILQREAEAKRIADAETARRVAATAPIINNTDAAKAASTTKIAEATIAKTEVAPIKELPVPENAGPLVDVALPSKQVEQSPVNATVTQANTTVTNTPLPNDIPVANMPERPAIANVPIEDIGNPASSIPSAQTTWAQGVDPNIAAAAPAEIRSTPVTDPIAPTSEAIAQNTAASTPPAPAQSGFDLGAVVDSIEIPQSEQERSVAAVDLKKLKADAAKRAAADAAKAKAAEADKKNKGDVSADEKSSKSKSKDKTALESPSRYWVQVATGNDTKGLGFDWRRLVKKNPELFKGREGWIAPWGKTNRLIVGPFTDSKSAKKWEAEFRKSGGNGFVWFSEKGAEIERVRSK